MNNILLMTKWITIQNRYESQYNRYNEKKSFISWTLKCYSHNSLGLISFLDINTLNNNLIPLCKGWRLEEQPAGMILRNVLCLSRTFFTSSAVWEENVSAINKDGTCSPVTWLRQTSSIHFFISTIFECIEESLSDPLKTQYQRAWSLKWYKRM